jgi:hypothetical protein
VLQLRANVFSDNTLFCMQHSHSLSEYSGNMKTSTVKSSGRQISNGSNLSSVHSLSDSALLGSSHSIGSVEEKIVLPNDQSSIENGSQNSAARFDYVPIPTERSDDILGAAGTERADSLDNNYSLIRERNSLLTRLEQVTLFLFLFCSYCILTLF